MPGTTDTTDTTDPTDTPTPAEGTAGRDPTSDEAILERLRAEWDYDTLNWQPIRDAADIDVAWAANDGWTEDDRKARGGRPMLNLDQQSQYRNQIANTVRQNKRGVKVSPAGNGATDKTAELRANRIREIEYQSHAQEAYSQAFSDCLTRSYGFARLVAEYEDADSDNQVIRTKAIPNPNQVLPDSDGESTSGRDWMRLFFVKSVSVAEFRRDWPTAQIQSFSPELIATSGKWLSHDRVQIAEYWIVTETDTGRGRPTREVSQYVTNGVELLHKKNRPKQTIWKGKYIPFAACYGRIIYRTTATGDSQKIMLSYGRFSQDASKGYNWTKSTMLEKIALPVRASLLGYKGQVDNDTLALIERSTTEPIPWIGFEPVVDAVTNQVLPLPQYGTREPDIQADLLAAEGFQRDIESALGRYNPQDQRRGNTKVTSGVALQELTRTADLGSFDYVDHYDDFLMFLGEQYDDLLQYYDDTAKEIAVRLPDGTPKMQRINTPTGRAPDGSPAFGPQDLRMTQGRHTITISTGPSTDSQREAGKEAAMSLLANPAAFPVVAADAMRLMDLGPIGDQMAKDLEFIQPPIMQQQRQQEQDGSGEINPQQLQRENAQLKQRLQQAEQLLQQAAGEVKGKQAEYASKEKIVGMQLEAEHKLQIELQTMKDATTISAAHIAAGAKGAAMDAHAQEEALALGHAADQADADRLHDAARSAQDHQEALDAGQQGQAHALEAAAQGQAHTLEAGQQAADLAPAPLSPDGTGG